MGTTRRIFALEFKKKVVLEAFKERNFWNRSLALSHSRNQTE